MNICFAKIATEATPGTTVSTRPTRPAVSTQTTSQLPSNKGTIPVTKGKWEINW